MRFKLRMSLFLTGVNCDTFTSHYPYRGGGGVFIRSRFCFLFGFCSHGIIHLAANPKGNF